VAEFQIAHENSLSQCYVDYLGENMVTHGKGRNFMVFNNLAFLTPFGFFWTWFGFFSQKMSGVAATDPTIWTSTYGLEPMLCNRLLVEPSGWAQTVHMFTQRLS